MSNNERWRCTLCYHRNEISNDRCQSCGQERDNLSNKKGKKGKKDKKDKKKKKKTLSKVARTNIFKKKAKEKPLMNEKQDNGWGQWFSNMVGTSARTLGDEMTVDTQFVEAGLYHLQNEHFDQNHHANANNGSIREAFTYDTEEDYLCRRQDFKYARLKRKEAYGGGNESNLPLGILGLYEHLANIRTDIEWADTVASRKESSQKYVSWSDFDDWKNSPSSMNNMPIFTYLIVIVSTVMMFVAMSKNMWKIEPISTNPMIGPSAQTLIGLGAKYTDYIVNQGQYYRLVTPMILHAGWIHYILNMIAIYAIGSAIEIAHGSFKTAVIFICSSIGGTILSALFLPEYISVGASGGIFGFIGACLADIVLNWNLVFGQEYNLTEKQDFWRKATIVIFLAGDIALNCMIGLTPFVDNFTHMGGLFYGFVCGIIMIEKITLERRSRSNSSNGNSSRNLMQASRTIIGCIIILLCVKFSLLYLLTGDGETSPCPSCMYTSCVEFPPWKPVDQKWWYCDKCGSTTGDAQMGDNGYYTYLLMNCPDNSQLRLDVTSYYAETGAELQSELPSLCRKYCENTHY